MNPKQTPRSKDTYCRATVWNFIRTLNLPLVQECQLKNLIEGFAKQQAEKNANHAQNQ